MNAIDLRLGDWRTALADVTTVDALICDPPYGARTHAGRRTGSDTRKSNIHYEPITTDDIAEFVASWYPRTREWFVIFGDDETAQAWKKSLAAAGAYVFAPIPWVKPNAPPRMSGDGPASACEHIVVARKRTRLRRMGSRPGFYTCPTSSCGGDKTVVDMVAHPGRKPLGLMRALVRDYSEAGDLVADPFAGTGTTLEACAIEGRRAVGSELDPDTYAKAQRRIARGYTPSMFHEAPASSPALASGLSLSGEQ